MRLRVALSTSDALFSPSARAHSRTAETAADGSNFCATTFSFAVGAEENSRSSRASRVASSSAGLKSTIPLLPPGKSPFLSRYLHVSAEHVSTIGPVTAPLSNCISPNSDATTLPPISTSKRTFLSASPPSEPVPFVRSGTSEGFGSTTLRSNERAKAQPSPVLPVEG